jgi:hypothetical protein
VGSVAPPGQNKKATAMHCMTVAPISPNTPAPKPAP